MKYLLQLSLFLGIYASLIAQTNVKTYIPTTQEIANPERGIYHYTEAQSGQYVLLNQNTLENWRTQDNITLIIRIFYIKDFINSPIAQSYLDNMQTDFDRLRNAGLKAIIKFAYSEDTNGAYDASKSQILSHINQLTPVLSANSDVIAAMQAGFIGVWGEWYYTNHFGMPPNATDLNNRRDIVEALLNALPEDRMLQIRTPKLKQDMYSTTAITENQAFASNSSSRIGHHNDCFLASDTDYGTYTNVQQEYPYLTQETRFTPMGGETCNPNEPRSGCTTAVQEMEMFHWSYLNSDYHPNVLQNFSTEGCYQEIKNRLGYRFSLVSGSYPEEIATQLPFSFEVTNSGFASLFNPRSAYLVLRNTQTQDEFKIALATDVRSWAPDATHVITEDLTLPNDLYDGSYELFLHLPDSRNSLQNNPTYAIQLANEGLWEPQTGYNKLDTTVIVNQSVLATKTVTQEKSFSVYPVPAKDKLIIELNEATAYTYELYTAIGQKVNTPVYRQTNNITELDVSHLAQGIYMLVIHAESAKLVKKVYISS